MIECLNIKQNHVEQGKKSLGLGENFCVLHFYNLPSFTDYVKEKELCETVQQLQEYAFLKCFCGFHCYDFYHTCIGIMCL